MGFIKIVDVFIVLFSGLIWAGIGAFLWLKKKKRFAYLLFFTAFFVYAVKVLDYTLFQFQSLVLLKYFVPGLILNGLSARQSFNIIPLATLTPQDLKTSLLNVLLMVPFGFLLPLIKDFRMKEVVVAGMLFSVAIELMQLVTGLVAKVAFRVADINDVIFNTLGVAIGYALFVGFVRACRYLFGGQEIRANPIVRYIAERPQVGAR